MQEGNVTCLNVPVPSVDGPRLFTPPRPGLGSLNTTAADTSTATAATSSTPSTLPPTTPHTESAKANPLSNSSFTSASSDANGLSSAERLPALPSGAAASRANGSSLIEAASSSARPSVAATVISTVTSVVMTSEGFT
ncbi:hypothetical protein OOU_Y34scaffold01039g9 [Pyricularia oryzae Y34]|uniref:Uncharacterized protein n=1 Tax=Pyricularia oryzae (strain Y34) TaxID=1143189 RepID=A0AA97NMD1_PYRO3|nr:hypothetical protein OOU_Y34scaffold01039g9 [Pyricularia oryzae Y34]